MPNTNAAPTDLSLVITTRDRANTLPPTLDVLSRLRSRHSVDIVIVDNCSRDETPALLAAFSARSVLPVQTVICPTPGKARALNAGWRRARGRVIAFTDDDCYPDPGFLDCAIEAMSDPQIGFVGGRIVLHDPTDLRVTIREDLEPDFIPARSLVRAGSIQGANIVVRRDALDDVGGFDDNFGPGTPFVCEDIDLVQRMSTAGWNGRYDPRPTVAHHHRRKSPSDLRWLMRSYDSGRGAQYAKCLFVAGLRWRVLRHWGRSAFDDSPVELIHELGGAARYLWCRVTGQLEPAPTNRRP